MHGPATTAYSEMDMDMFKQKFDRFWNKNKKVGDPSCLLNFCLAKHIAQERLSRAQSMIFGIEP